MTMPVASLRAPDAYPQRLALLIWHALTQITRPASHSRRAQARRVWARRSLLLAAILAAAIVALMFALDAREIAWMPRRGTAGLWPLRIATDFGKSEYVLTALFVVLALVGLIAARSRGVAHATLLSAGTRLQFLFLATAVPNLAGLLLKGAVGRGRPFVGGEANAFNFSHFAWTESYASFPSGHAITSCALAIAIGSLWPRLRVPMAIYAVVIIGTRLLLLAHHPSDVVAGALLGIVGAMAVRYWFAARRLAFVIRSDGSIAARSGPSLDETAHAVRMALTGPATR